MAFPNGVSQFGWRGFFARTLLTGTGRNALFHVEHVLGSVYASPRLAGLSMEEYKSPWGGRWPRVLKRSACPSCI